MNDAAIAPTPITAQNEAVAAKSPLWPIRRTDKEIERVIKRLPLSLHLSNQELAKKFGYGVRQIENLIYGMGLKRTTEQRRAIAVRQNTGANNPVWKGGIGKNNYHWKQLQRQRYPQRVNARQAVYRAVKSGKLSRLPCQFPGCTEQKTFAHHHDYAKPLDVTWLCRPHHHAAHRQEQAAA